MKRLLLAVTLFSFSLPSFSQLLSWTPNFPQESTTPLVITMDATKGNQGLLNYTPVTDVYVHIGVITNYSTGPSNWKYSKFTWGTTTAAANATSLGGNKWSYTITGGLRAYFGIVDPTETILKIAILFRNGSGSLAQRNADASDMYIPIYTTAFASRFSLPLMQPTYVQIPETINKIVGNTIPTTGISNSAATLKLYFNGTLVQTAAAATTVSAAPTITTGGTQTLIFDANNGVTDLQDTIQFYVPGTVNVAALPAGVRDGINYYPGDATKATLVLYAPGKSRVAAIGDFPNNNWTELSTYELNRTPDGNYWWITINGLTAGNEYSFQYLVDGNVRIGDPYCEKILDPWNDQYIPSTTYPALKAYPAGKTSGIVSILQTAAPAYTWSSNSYTRPDKRNLIIYELLVRDFVAAHDFTTVMDSLNYLKKLGVNAIEFMPVNEFEGNSSWGYNPNYYLAPDKYYGPSNTYKRLIDSCHSRGIAVIMDIALNHSFGTSPLVQLYWDTLNSRPALANPWFNPVAKHAYNVGYDMNHQSPATQYFFGRIMEHWINNYKIDGFRFDLSKGFTQTQTCDANGANCNVAAWGNYDASRVAIWEKYYDTIQAKKPGTYTILEHFADNSEETVLANYGMMPWGNENYNYNQASMGFNSAWDFSWGVYTARGWAQPNLVSYMESHDEERLMYNNEQYGNVSGSYNIKTLNTGLARMEMNGAFFFTIPGPKMIWQFGELGYDFSINTCVNGTVNNTCRLDPKPIRWDYDTVTARLHLFNTWSKLIKLRYQTSFAPLFTTGTVAYNFASAFKWLTLHQGTTGLVSIGNFDVVFTTGSVTFPSAGVWYDYLNGTTIVATGGAQTFGLQPGEFHVYTSLNPLPVTLLDFSGRKGNAGNILTWNVTNEQNLSYYELQRSSDGQNFVDVARVNASGNTSYSYTDLPVTYSSVYFYRLKSVDADGQFTYSAIVKIRTSSNAVIAEVSPNPFGDILNLSVDVIDQGNANIIVSDITGRQLINKTASLLSGNNALQLDTRSLAKGTYIVSLILKDETKSIRVIKGY